MNIKRIPLECIVLEKQFRNYVEDQRLTDNIKKNGLQEPLTVEGPIKNNRFILISGYRRYNSIQQLRFKEVECNVEEVTNAINRLFKRLTRDIHTKCKTGYEIERMIEYLLEKGYKLKEIASELNIAPSTVRRYIKSLDVEKTLKKRAEHAKVGRDGLTRLYGLKNTILKVKNELIERYINKEIFGYQTKYIEKADKNPHFKNLTERGQRKCINDIVEIKNTNWNSVERIVHSHSLRYNYNEESLDYVYREVCNDICRIKEDCSRNFIENLDKSRIEHLDRLFSSILEKESSPIFKKQTKRYKHMLVNNIKFISRTKNN